MSTLQATRAYEIVHSSCCDIEFAMPVWFYNQTHRTGETWYCPRGHSRVWKGKTTEQKLQEAEAQARHLEDQLGAAVRDAEETRVALLRDRQRFANGVCPCCNRSFQNVRRHMESKHPDYDVTKVNQSPARRFQCSCGARFETFRGLRIHQGHSRVPGWDKPGASKWRAHLTRV